MASLTFSSYAITTYMSYDGKHGNKGYKYPSTGSYELYIKSETNEKNEAKRTTVTTGPRPTSVNMGTDSQKQQLIGFFHTVNGQAAETIQKLYSASLTLSSRPFPCVNNILIPGMILTVTAGSELFPEFPSGSKWMVDSFKIDQVVSKGFNTYEFDIVVLRYYGNLG